jgi:hypothetical protein
MRSRAIVLLIPLLTGCKNDSGAKPEVVPAPVVTSAPAAPPPAQKTRFEIFRALLVASDLPLAKARHCENVIGVDAGKTPTLGDWIAYNLSLMEKGALELPASCSAETKGQSCKVEFSVRNDAENVLWRWGVAFRLDGAGSVDRATVSCIGAG